MKNEYHLKRYVVDKKEKRFNLSVSCPFNYGKTWTYKIREVKTPPHSLTYFKNLFESL